MLNIKEVVNRINSITSTQQITKAMKVVAAARLNKVQQQVLQMRPYAEKLAAILENVTTACTTLPGGTHGKKITACSDDFR
jgi:F-type H+-transporting ATPase subunit gamma